MYIKESVTDWLIYQRIDSGRIGLKFGIQIVIMTWMSAKNVFFKFNPDRDEKKFKVRNPFFCMFVFYAFLNYWSDRDETLASRSAYDSEGSWLKEKCGIELTFGLREMTSSYTVAIIAITTTPKRGSIVFYNFQNGFKKINQQLSCWNDWKTNYLKGDKEVVDLWPIAFEPSIESLPNKQFGVEIRKNRSWCATVRTLAFS